MNKGKYKLKITEKITEQHFIHSSHLTTGLSPDCHPRYASRHHSP